MALNQPLTPHHSGPTVRFQNLIPPKSTIQVLCLLLGLLLVLPLSRASAQTAASAQTPQGRPTVTSDSGYYYAIFHHVAALKQKADAAQQQGKDRSNLRQLVRQRASLTESEGESLEQIALQCDSDVAAQDAKAKLIIDQFHAQYPPGEINPSFPPPVPPVLDSMWEERSKIILAARDRLRSALGEEHFANFDTYIKSTITAPGKPPVFPAMPGVTKH
jgi:hypothetical protein